MQGLHDKNDKVLAYGGVEVTAGMKEVITLNPKMKLYSRIDEIELECAVETGIMKARYEQMNKQQKRQENQENADENLDDDNEEDEKVVFDMEKKTLDLSNMRATDIPTCSRLVLPQPATLKVETLLENIKEKLMDKEMMKSIWKTESTRPYLTCV